MTASRRKISGRDVVERGVQESGEALENGDLDLMISELGIESSEHLDDIVRLLTGKEEERAIIIPSQSQGWFSIEGDPVLARLPGAALRSREEGTS